MNKKERCDAVRAMELLARAVNNENFFEEWLIKLPRLYDQGDREESQGFGDTNPENHESAV